MAGRVRVDGAARQQGRQPPCAREAAVDVHPGPRARGPRARSSSRARWTRSAWTRAAASRWTSAPRPAGFTETLLQRGATRVYAVDVGRGQLHESLRGDARVVVLERCQRPPRSRAREVPEACGIATVDVSFISVTKLLTPLLTVLAADADVARPGQAAVRGRARAGRPRWYREGLGEAPCRPCATSATAAQSQGKLAVIAACASPIAGHGRQPRVLPAPADGGRPVMPAAALEDLLARTARGMSTVGILVRPDLGKAGPAVRDLVAWLHGRSVGACIDEHTAALVQVADRRVLPRGLQPRGRGHARTSSWCWAATARCSRPATVVDRPVPVTRREFREPRLPHRDHACPSCTRL